MISKDLHLLFSNFLISSERCGIHVIVFVIFYSLIVLFMPSVPDSKYFRVLNLIESSRSFYVSGNGLQT